MVWPIGSCSTDAWRKIKRATRLNGGKQKCLADGRCADHESDARPPRPSSHLSPCPPHASPSPHTVPPRITSYAPGLPAAFPSSLHRAMHCPTKRHSTFLPTVIMRQASYSLHHRLKWCLPPGIIPSPLSVRHLAVQRSTTCTATVAFELPSISQLHADSA